MPRELKDLRIFLFSKEKLTPCENVIYFELRIYLHVRRYRIKHEAKKIKTIFGLYWPLTNLCNLSMSDKMSRK